MLQDEEAEAADTADGGELDMSQADSVAVRTLWVWWWVWSND